MHTSLSVDTLLHGLIFKSLVLTSIMDGLFHDAGLGLRLVNRYESIRGQLFMSRSHDVLRLY